jgi:hypothetical protein
MNSQEPGSLDRPEIELPLPRRRCTERKPPRGDRTGAISNWDSSRVQSALAASIASTTHVPECDLAIIDPDQPRALRDG